VEELRAAPPLELAVWGPVLMTVGAALGCSWLAGMSGWGAAGLMLALALALAGLAAQRAGLIAGRPRLIQAGLALLLAMALAGGIAAALFRAEAVRAPVVEAGLGQRLVEGRALSLDRTTSGAWRVLLAPTGIDGLAADQLPRRVRITLRPQQEELPAPGATLSCLATLNPPPGPVVPGAYDFARTAWFRELGGVGYAVRVCELSAPDPAAGGWGAALERARTRAAAYLAEGHGGAGGFLAAVATGDRSWLVSEDVEALQASGLAHIVSVSGLHVSLVSGLVFLFVLKLLAAWPWLALRIDVRKPAAGAAFAVALAYTVFTGAEAPAVRACVMTGVVLGAVLLERRAFTRRGLALAALLIVVVRPESAIEPGFQMSFLATLALVSLWEGWGRGTQGIAQLFQDPRGWILATLASSLVAGLATAPVAAAVFHRVAPWGMVANLLAVPVEDLIVGPAALAGALLAPVGLDGPFWALARWGLGVILAIAHWVASWPGAGAAVVPTGPAAPLLLTGATLLVCLARTWLRWLAVVPAVLGLVIWAASPRTELWIAPQGRAALATVPGQLPQLCFLQGARFDGVRLINEAGLDRRSSEALTPPPRSRGDSACQLRGPDWTLHFETIDRGWGGSGTGDATFAPYLVIAGAHQPLAPGALDQGGRVERRSEGAALVIARPSQAPWHGRFGPSRPDGTR
jgi:competence protein ComEC